MEVDPAPSDTGLGRGRDGWPDGIGEAVIGGDEASPRFQESADDDETDFDSILARLESQEKERSGRSGSSSGSDDIFGHDDELPGVLRGRLRDGETGAKRRRPPAWATWATAGLVVVIAVLGGLYFLRDSIVAAVPSTEGVYAALGIPLNRPGLGLALDQIVPTFEQDGADQVFVVRGLVVNRSETDRPVPTLRLMVTDAEGVMVQEKTAPPPQDQLAPGETTPFRIVLRHPLPQAAGARVGFTERPADPMMEPPPRGQDDHGDSAAH
ncbi:DUF3426 domain-containing protein [Roseospira marina]|uniref:DUF3426 domain-containing protein n=1 Tax=Roseospira marina TaxID=140057 RepID=UPI00161A8DAB|nr:DUF3426 domain-containing protein [Roseospira marina]MBB4315553.1 hypothetical protein [Roseospira marina]MBB5088510.1 hypothetical protein [Roseospira marina]